MKGGGARFDRKRNDGQGEWVAFTESGYSYTEAAMFNILENIARRHGYYSTTSTNLEDFLKHGRQHQLFGGQDINTLLSWLSNDPVWYGEVDRFLTRLDASIESRDVVDGMHKDKKHSDFTASLKIFRGLIDVPRHRADVQRIIDASAASAASASAAAAAVELDNTRKKNINKRDQRFYDAYATGGLMKLADEWFVSNYKHALFHDDDAQALIYLTQIAGDLKIDMEEFKTALRRQKQIRLDSNKARLAKAFSGGKKSKRKSKRRVKKSKCVR